QVRKVDGYELSSVATFDGDFGDASLEGLTVELSGFFENNSLCSVHHVGFRHVRSDRDRRNLLGINGESRRSLMLSRALSSLDEDHSHRRYRLHRWSIGSSVAGTGA
ncbi:MAG: hypothetical protein M3112_02105, partial [Actinomycetia bacterium]|nr:hypothetical protein [Actinomycetes bacterium]